MEAIYERTEYDRITPPIVKRYQRISRERGCTVIPLSATGQPAECHREQYDRDHGRIAENEAGDNGTADADTGSSERSWLGFQRFSEE